MLSCNTLALLLDTCQAAVAPPSRKLLRTTSLAVSVSMCWCVHVPVRACACFCNALTGLTANRCLHLKHLSLAGADAAEEAEDVISFRSSAGAQRRLLRLAERPLRSSLTFPCSIHQVTFRLLQDTCASPAVPDYSLYLTAVEQKRQPRLEIE